MKLELRLVPRLLLAALMCVASAAHAEVVTEKTLDVPLEDLRDSSSKAVQKRVRHFAREGIVVTYAGEPTQVANVVREVASEAASHGLQVRAVLLTKAGSVSGATIHGQDGGALGPIITVDQDVRAQTKAQIEALRARLERSGTATAAVDPLDVVRCRTESTTGSLARKTKVCSTPRQDAERTRRAKQWTSEQQNRGANEPMKDPMMGPTN